MIRQDATPQDGTDGTPSHQPPDLLFVHGAWHGAWCWSRIQTLCALAGLRSHAVNLRGHGGSSGHEHLSRTRLDEYVADVAQVARELDRPFVLLGHSLGGIVAQRYLSRTEQGHDLPSPTGIVLLATALPADMASAFRSPSTTRYFGGQLGMLRMLLRMRLTGDATTLVATPELVRALFFTPETSEQEVMDCFIRLQNESITALREVQRLARVWQTPRRAAMPMLVLGGARDACFPPADLRRLAAAYGATLHLFAGMGHDLMLDRGWEQVAGAIVEWVGGLSANDEQSSIRTAPRPGAQVIPLRPLLVAPMADVTADHAGDAHDVTQDHIHMGMANGRFPNSQAHTS